MALDRRAPPCLRSRGACGCRPLLPALEAATPYVECREVLAREPSLLAAWLGYARSRAGNRSAVGGGAGAPAGLAAAVVTGCLLAYGSGIDVRALLGGDLVELAGPDRPGHTLARATHATLGAIAEESLFRGAVLALHALAPATIGATILAFVARHRLLKGAAPWSARTLAVEIVGAALFTGLALASGSVVPAIAAHLTANAPFITLQIQRARLGRSRRPDRAAQRGNAHRSD